MNRTAHPISRRPPVAARRPAVLLVGTMGLLGLGVLAGHLHHQRPSAALTSPTTTVARVTLKGYVLAARAPRPCLSGPNGIRAGAGVNVVGPTGVVLGSARLGVGLPANHGGCTWAWSLPVPAVSGFQIQVGGLPIAGITRARLAHQGWNFYENDTTDVSNLLNIESGV